MVITIRKSKLTLKAPAVEAPSPEGDAGAASVAAKAGAGGEAAGGTIWIVKLMVLAGTAATNGEARRLIKGGGVTFGGEKAPGDDYELPLPADGILKVANRTLGFYPEYACRTLNAFCWALQRTNDPRYLDALEQCWRSSIEFLHDRNVESEATRLAVSSRDGLAVAGSGYVQIGAVTPALATAGAAIGCLAAAVLVVNNHRDIAHDAVTGRRTFGVLFGSRASAGLYALLMLVPFTMVPLLVWQTRSLLLWLPLLALPGAVGLVRALPRTQQGADLNALLMRTVMLQLIFGAMLTISTLVAAWL